MLRGPARCRDTDSTCGAPASREHDREMYKDGTLTELPYSARGEIQEAVANFRAYIAILQEWDRKEKESENRQSALGDCQVEPLEVESGVES